jgi:hypothetical protein
MVTALARALVGLSIAAGSLAFAHPAAATVWKNLANENYCLGVTGSSTTAGTSLVLRQCDGSATQRWERSSYMSYYYQLWNLAAPAPGLEGARCVGTAGGAIGNGTPLILWSCNSTTQSHDQGWDMFFRGWDDDNHQCWSFVNQKAVEGSPPLVRALGVSGGIMTNGRPIILWDRFETGHPDQTWCAY